MIILGEIPGDLSKHQQSRILIFWLSNLVNENMATIVTNNFEIPNWAGKPSSGFHVDVFKEEKMIQKLMIDEKSCYFFGRHKQSVDFCIDHDSCSRVHAALVWHKFLDRFFLIDLGSTHGTFIGNLRLESKKPQQIPTGSVLRFGASSRSYVIRDTIQTKILSQGESENMNFSDGVVPEDESQLDELTEFNTARNRCTPFTPDMEKSGKRKHKKTLSVHFNPKEIILNLEDVDPTVGRFRNLCQTTIITKKTKLEFEAQPYQRETQVENVPLKEDADELGFKIRINSAPEISEVSRVDVAKKPLVKSASTANQERKHYVKESWPGRNPASVHSFLEWNLNFFYCFLPELLLWRIMLYLFLWQ